MSQPDLFTQGPPAPPAAPAPRSMIAWQCSRFDLFAAYARVRSRWPDIDALIGDKPL